MSANENPPRKSVPAPRVTSLARAWALLTSPNAIRTAAVAVFFVVWEFFGRRMDPIFMAPPSAIFEAGIELTKSGALRKAMVESLAPFAVGLALTIVIGILIGYGVLIFYPALASFTGSHL